MNDIYYKKHPHSTLLECFEHALKGIWNVWQKESNFKIEVFAALVVIGLMIILPLSLLERAVLIIMIAIVLSLEIINSISEKILDIVHPGFSKRVRSIKDSMAGAVFLGSLVSVTVGSLILIPALLEFDPIVLKWATQFLDTKFFNFNRNITYLGSSSLLIFVGVLIAVLFLIKKKYQAAFFMAGLMMIGEGFVWLIKEMIARPRPLGAELIETNGFSFPSGHTFSALIFWFGLAYLFGQVKGLEKYRNIFWFFALIIAILVAASRIFLTVHWLSDVMGALVIGTVWFLLWLGIVKKF